MIYYGVSMKTDFLGGDFYMTFIVGGIAEVPALLLLYVLIDRVGRKPLFAGGYFVAALCMLSNLLLPAKGFEFFAKFLVVPFSRMLTFTSPSRKFIFIHIPYSNVQSLGILVIQHL